MKKLVVKCLVLFLPLFFALSVTASAKICISDIYIQGNKVTNPNIILREIPIRIGTFISQEGLDHKVMQSKENLQNTSLFNEVTITYEPDTHSSATHICNLESYVKSMSTYQTGEEILFYRVVINVTERWYYWPVVGLKLEERNLSTWLKDMDFSKLTFDAGIKIYNMLGLKHKLTLSGRFGYEKGGKLSYDGVTLDPKGEHSLSASAYYLYNKTINSMCEENRPVYRKSPMFLEKNTGGSISYLYRPEIRIRHTASIEYNYRKLNDSVLIWNPDYYSSANSSSHEYSLRYKFAFDQRDYFAYPTKGYYIGVNAKGTAADDFNFWYGNVVADIQYYGKLGKRWFASTAWKLSTSFKNKTAYIYDRAIGYNKADVCGYESYTVDGQHYVTSHNSLKFLLLPEKVVTLDFLRALSKFYKIPFTIYITASADMGYAYNKYNQGTNSLQNKFLMGASLGIDILTYYDIVLNVSYAYTILNEGGFVFGLKTSIF